MGKKRKQQCKKVYKVTNEERKIHNKIRRFGNTLRKGKTVAEINSHTLRDIAGAVQILQRVAMLKSQDTSNMVKDLERQTKKGPAADELSRGAIRDKLTIANTLIAQGMHWDKVEGALVRFQCLCKNEDEILWGPWEFQCQELAPTTEDKDQHKVFER